METLCTQHSTNARMSCGGCVCCWGGCPGTWVGLSGAEVEGQERTLSGRAFQCGGSHYWTACPGSGYDLTQTDNLGQGWTFVRWASWDMPWSLQSRHPDAGADIDGPASPCGHSSCRGGYPRAGSGVVWANSPEQMRVLSK